MDKSLVDEVDHRPQKVAHIAGDDPFADKLIVDCIEAGKIFDRHEFAKKVGMSATSQAACPLLP